MQSVLQSVVGPKEVRPEKLDGCVAVVTGGAQGIGYETSRALAHAGCRVIIVSRTADHGHAAIAKIKEESPNAEVEWKDCDMGDLKQIKSVFSELRDSLARIDFLVFSAGINASQYELTADGIERVFAINYLGQFYAANQLWPKIRETALTPGTAPTKIVAISSEMHRAAPSEVKFADLDEINNPSLDPVQLYGRSKLAQILFVKFGLAGKVIKPKWDPIYAFAVHPGTVSNSSAVVARRHADLRNLGEHRHTGTVEGCLSWHHGPASQVCRHGRGTRRRAGLI